MSSFVKKLSAAIASRETLTIYRFTNDVLPSRITHFYKGDGVYGPCTYFSLDDRTTKNFDADYILHFKYSAKPNNPLYVTPKQLEGLDDADVLIVVEDQFLGMKQGSEFDARLLTKKATKLNYDSIIITGSPHLEGGKQLLGLREFPVTVLSMSVCVSEKYKKDVFSKLKKSIKSLTTRNCCALDISPKYISIVDKVLHTIFGNRSN